MVRVRRWIVLLGWHMFNGYVSFKQCFSVSLSYFLHIPHTCMFEQHCYPIGTQKLRYFWTTQTDPELWSRIDWCSIVHPKLRLESCSLLNFHQLTDIETNKIVSFIVGSWGKSLFPSHTNRAFPRVTIGCTCQTKASEEGATYHGISCGWWLLGKGCPLNEILYGSIIWNSEAPILLFGIEDSSGKMNFPSLLWLYPLLCGIYMYHMYHSIYICNLKGGIHGGLLASWTVCHFQVQALTTYCQSLHLDVSFSVETKLHDGCLNGTVLGWLGCVL